MFWNKSKPKKLTKEQEYEQIGKLVASIHDSGYMDHKTAYKMSFFKGVAGGFGGVIGATIVVALLLWVLSLFSQVPFIGNISDKVQQTVDSSTN